MALKRGELLVHIAFETEEDNYGPTRNHIIAQQKRAFLNLKNASAITTIYDDENFIGQDISGNPSDELRDIAEEAM